MPNINVTYTDDELEAERNRRRAMRREGSGCGMLFDLALILAFCAWLASVLG